MRSCCLDVKALKVTVNFQKSFQNTYFKFRRHNIALCEKYFPFPLRWLTLLAAYKVALAIAATLVILYSFQGYYPEFIWLLSNALPPLVAGAAVISSGVSLQKYWRNSKERFSKVWLFFTVGLFLWFLGESVWMGYTLILNVETPYPSVADAFRLIGYLPMFLALYLYVRIFSLVLSKKLAATSLTITALMTIFVSMALINPVLGSGEDLTTMVVDFAYPLLDILLFSVSLLGLLIFSEGTIGKSWFLINAAIFSCVIGHMLFSYTTLQGTYYSGHLLELFFHFGYIFFLLSFPVHVEEL